MRDDLPPELFDMGIPEGEEPPHDGDLSFTQPENIVPLGHDRGIYYYLSRATGQVEAIPAASHTRAMLSHLASEANFWQHSVFWRDKKGVDWDAAADHYRTECRKVGIFDPERLRGRGVWIDEGRVVLHVGDGLVVGGSKGPLDLSGSRYVYEHARRLDVRIGVSCTTLEAKRFLDLCCAAPWEAPAHMGRLLAGWCVIAMVCGALPWRPHLWLTSEAGSGKSWVLDHIIKPIVGALALKVQSKTTEAGIRQALGADSLPVLFDEAETQNDRDRERIQLVLDLARQASTEDGAQIVKGTARGAAQYFRIRSCFCFFSVNMAMHQAADQSRTVVLALKPSDDLEKRLEDFNKLKAILADVMTPDLPPNLLARTLKLLPAIRQNSEIFANAIARSGATRRVGDTYGVLLAGAWSLRSSNVASAAEADAFVAGQDWVKEAFSEMKSAESEWQTALMIAMRHSERVTNTNGKNEDIPIGELVQVVVTGRSEMGSINPTDASMALRRMGLKVGEYQDSKVLFVANRAVVLDKVFATTQWGACWLRTLSRVPGAIRNAAIHRLPTPTKCMALPIETIIGPD
jgi:putative DNA primase/helicase